MRQFSIIVLAWLLLGSSLAVSLAAGDIAVNYGQTAQTDLYQQWMLSCLDGLEKDLPQITASAEAVAELYVKQDHALVLGGVESFASEAYGRAGGIMPIDWLKYRRWRNRPVVLFYALREEAAADDYQVITRETARGGKVILLGRKAQLDDAVKAGIAPLGVVDIHAAEHNGLFQSADGQWLVPTDPIARLAAEWVWQAEFVAACTRLGKMPTMWKSNGGEGGLLWNEKYRGKRFHETLPTVVAPGVLGKAYLDALRSDLRTLYAVELGRIVQVARWAVEARAAGRTAYTFSNGHGALLDPGCLHDPRYFRQLSTTEYTVDPAVTLAAGDVILYIAQGGMPIEWGAFANRDLPGDWRKAGVKLAWSFGNLQTREFSRNIALIQPNEPFIDQHFRFADGAIWLDGYGIPLFPDSGITSEAVLWLATAEVYGKLLARTPAQ
ncbi:MAG: hypothetical protein ACYDBB_04030 [Armatimonadota bacterium]